MIVYVIWTNFIKRRIIFQEEEEILTKYIDLSYEIEHQMAVYPGDDELKLYRHRFLNRDYYNDTKLETGMHVGTHIDAPTK